MNKFDKLNKLARLLMNGMGVLLVLSTTYFVTFKNMELTSASVTLLSFSVVLIFLTNLIYLLNSKEIKKKK